MASEITLHSSIGNYNFDPSSLLRAGMEDALTRLGGAIGPDGNVDSNVLVQLMEKYPTAFHLVAGPDIKPPPGGPLATPHYQGIVDDLSSMLLKAMSAGIESLSDIRNDLNNAAISEAQQNIASAKKEKDFAFAAAETKRNAEVTTGATQLASSSAQGAMSVGSGAMIARAGMATGRMQTAHDSLKGFKAERATTENRITQLQVQRADAVQRGGNVQGIDAELATTKSRLRQHEDNISEAQSDANLEQQLSAQHTEGSRFVTATTRSLGEITSGSGNTAAAGMNFDSAISTANSKFTDAEQQNDATNRDLFNGGAQDALRAIGEVIDAAKQVAQGTTETAKNMAHNMA